MRIRALPPSLILGAALALQLAAIAQQPATTNGVESFGGFAVRETPVTGYRPAVPMPPKVLFGTLSAHVDPPIPIGPARAGPDSPESDVIDPAVVDAGVFRYFQNEDVTPSGQLQSTTGEPTVAQTDHVVFQTGNWYAARSVDNGSSWEHVSPFSFFAARDGGFCCDQKIVYVPSHDISIWVLQYSYSSSTQQNGYRIAVANGDADLANPSASAWTPYYITPQFAGFATRRWFDFPDCAYSDSSFFLSANVYDDGAPASYMGSAIMRLELNDLQANVSSLPVRFINSGSHGVDFSPRMARGGNPSDRIFWATLTNTSTLEVGYYTDAGTFSIVSRGIGSLSTTINSTPSPDGVNWATRAPTRFRGAYGNSTEVGFLFTSGPIGSRPNPHLRICRFTADSNRTLIGERDVWSPTLAFTYGAAATNSLGHVGLVCATGSVSSYVHSVATLVDQYQSWSQAWTLISMGAGQDSPDQNRWGDYFDVQQHADFPNTFVGTGMRQRGGASDSFNKPQFVWFGRDDYEPTWVNLTVRSVGPAVVTMTLEQTDMDGLKDGSTTMTRRFTPNQPYSLTAPRIVSVGGVFWEFERWRYRVSPTGSFLDRPIGDQTLTLSSIGSQDDTCEAVYKLRRTLTVQSTNPSSGVAVIVSPLDVSGNGDGSTTFTRDYRDDETVTLTAPDTVGFNPFRYWRIGGMVVLGGSRTVQVTMDADKTATAVYWTNVPGQITGIGAGCTSSLGTVPSHTITWPAGQQGPQQGTVTSYRLSGAPPLRPVTLLAGLSNQTWNNFQLPFDLTVIGVNGCLLHHDIVSTQRLATGALGDAVFPMTWPVDRNAIGVSIFTSFSILDPGVNRQVPLTLSNAMGSRIGGNQ